MTDAGFGRDIGRDDDALRWRLATEDVVASVNDWAMTAVPGQRAVAIAPGQAQTAQITSPEVLGAKTSAVPALQLAQPTAMTYAGKLICREYSWYGTGTEADPLTGTSEFVVLDAGDYAAWPEGPPPLADIPGLVQQPGVSKHHQLLYFAAVHQSTNEVRLADLRRISPMADGRRSGRFAAGWGGGAITWVRNGNIITVDINGSRLGGNIEIPRWQGVLFGSGLPRPSRMVALNEPQTNQQEYGAFSWTLDRAGDLYLTARWSARSYNKDGWIQGQFSYITDLP